MIDLHMHTTASDGRHSTEELVQRVRAVGIQTFSVTDHDTVAAIPEAARLASEAGLEFVAGIEITAVYERKDIHLLGYFLDCESRELVDFLMESRSDRIRRARLMGDKLARLGVPIDIDELLEAAGGAASGKAIARPVVARALVSAGHVRDVQEAFDRYLADDRQAYVPREGASPAEVVRIIATAGGICSLAHPGTLNRDGLIPELVDAGLTAIEAYHSDHSPATTERYLSLARQYGLAVSGGSDYHGEGTRHAESFGRIGLPRDSFVTLSERGTAGKLRT
jgi:predicted metal-dependent phosphoesterase TrpH